MIVFDIETGALPLEEIKRTLPPFDRSSIPHPGEFNPDSVKLGRLGPEKAAAKIAEAKEKHAKAVANHKTSIEHAEAAYWQSALKRGALSSVTGQVVAIGYLGRKTELDLAGKHRDERDILLRFWEIYQMCRADKRRLVGFNSNYFDVPFIVQRSYVNAIDVPRTVLTPTNYLDGTFVDLADRWKAGNRRGGEKGHGTLDTICKALNVPGKFGEMKGADFAAALNSGDDELRAKAIKYLESDLEATQAVANRLSVS